MKKKILVTINTMGRAGAEMALIELVKKLDKMNLYEIYLYSIIPCGELFDSLPKNVKIINKKAYNYSLNSLKGKMIIYTTILKALFNKATGVKLFPYLVKNIKYQKKLLGKIQFDKVFWRVLSQGLDNINIKFDLAIAYIEGAATYFIADKVKAKNKVSFVHIDYKAAGYRPFMDMDAYKHMSRIYAVSNEVANKFLQVYPQHKNKVKLFRNLLDRQAIITKANNGESFIDNFKGTRIVTVGRLHYQKGYDIAIETLNILIKEGYDIRWYIIGEGSERSNLEARIKKYKLEDRFILMGSKDNPYPYIKDADLYVHATRFEGKSIAIEEAQILGKAIIASNCTGNKEQIISDFDGKLVELKSKTLAKEIKNIINNKEIIKKYEKNVEKKKLDYPEDLNDMLSLLM